MKTDCTLTGSSSCQVTQSFTLEISGAQTQLRFPLSAGAKKASVAGYQTQKQTDGDCPVLVLTDANGFTGTRSFTVMYTISGLASEADGVQTLSLPLMSAKWDYPISKYVFTVTLPKPFESYPAFTSGYHGDVISDYIDLDVSESRITGVIETGLKDHESLEMTLTLDKSYFSGAHTTLSFGWAGTAIILLLLALAFLYWFSSLRSARVRVSSRMLPPDAALPCDMPFLLAGGPIQFNMLVCRADVGIGPYKASMVDSQNMEHTMEPTRRPEDEVQLNKTPAEQEEPEYSLEEIMNEFGGWTKREEQAAEPGETVRLASPAGRAPDAPASEEDEEPADTIRFAPVHTKTESEPERPAVWTYQGEPDPEPAAADPREARERARAERRERRQAEKRRRQLERFQKKEARKKRAAEQPEHVFSSLEAAE